MAGVKGDEAFQAEFKSAGDVEEGVVAGEAGVLRACRSGVWPHFKTMISTEFSRTALQLSPEDRLELARRLVESVADPVPLNEAVKAGIRRIEDVAAGRVVGLSEEQYLASLV